MDAERTPHLPRMKAPNHLRCIIPSLAREEKGLESAMTAKDRLQFLLWVLVGCSGRVQRGQHAGSAWAPINLFALCSLSIDGRPIKD